MLVRFPTGRKELVELPALRHCHCARQSAGWCYSRLPTLDPCLRVSGNKAYVSTCRRCAAAARRCACWRWT
eukprot:scaffold329601_cov58-Tisochrysis_lutea.AAC.1